ncbi:response regulator [Haloferax sp. DFSO52]|uniref:response regulator n=1 Tax=Haloferax sp. DFSO52 TaxID=3388505 RepID=UPI003A8587F1
MRDYRVGDPVDILVVEDNPGDVRLTKEAFKEAQLSCELHVVTNGEEALDFLYRRNEYESAIRPHFVLLDLNLPKVDGMTVLEKICDEPVVRRTPVVVLTSSEAEEDIVEAYELQVNAYLTKPNTPDDFVELVQTLNEFWFELAKLPPIQS